MDCAPDLSLISCGSRLTCWKIKRARKSLMVKSLVRSDLTVSVTPLSHTMCSILGSSTSVFIRFCSGQTQKAFDTASSGRGTQSWFCEDLCRSQHVVGELQKGARWTLAEDRILQTQRSAHPSKTYKELAEIVSQEIKKGRDKARDDATRRKYRLGDVTETQVRNRIAQFAKTEKSLQLKAENAKRDLAKEKAAARRKG
jgi:hypothetical protein